MSPMNAVRIAISLFIAVLIGVAATGWVWTGAHQPAAQAIASRAVLTLCMLAGLVGLGALWRRRPTSSQPHDRRLHN
jgi:membrane protein YdbS with pleckstrin-like domain